MFSDPMKNLRALSLRDNMIVADLGAGTGFYSLAAASLVPQGKVYAIEIQKEYLSTIKNKAREAHIDNIECFWGNVEKLGGTKIKDEVVDAVIASNILFQIENKDRFIEEARRILKTDGTLLLIDWSHVSSLSPKTVTTLTKDKVRELFLAKGFSFEKEIDAGAHHYGMIFRRQKHEK